MAPGIGNSFLHNPCPRVNSYKLCIWSVDRLGLPLLTQVICLQVFKGRGIVSNRRYGLDFYCKNDLVDMFSSQHLRISRSTVLTTKVQWPLG